MGTSVSWRSRVISHPLDHLENFTNDWVAHLQENDPVNPEYDGPRCPFAKKASLRFRKVYDYFSAYDFWEVVAEEVEKYDGSTMNESWLLEIERNKKKFKMVELKGGAWTIQVPQRIKE